MSYLLDTNICIYYLKGTYPALRDKMLSVHPSDIKIPAVVKAELLYGAEKSVKRDENMAKAYAFLMPFEIAPFGDAASVYYSSIRASLEKEGKPIGPNDLFIAAIAQAEKAVLVTNNIKEHQRISGIRLENWIE